MVVAAEGLGWSDQVKTGNVACVLNLPAMVFEMPSTLTFGNVQSLQKNFMLNRSSTLVRDQALYYVTWGSFRSGKTEKVREDQSLESQVI